jgi:glycolate oxidase
LVQTDGVAAELEADLAAGALREFATDLAVTSDPDEANQLIAVRRAALPSLEQVGRILIEDISVPRSQLSAAVEAIEAAAETTGVAIYTFAHAADGNLHPVIVLSEHQDPMDSEVQAAADLLFAAALRLGGTVSGEHGVGVLKRQWMRRELGEDIEAIQHQLKAAFDPAGILNPGKAI